MEHATTLTDRARFSELLHRHRGIVFKVSNTYARNADDRADLAQEIAAQLWRAWPGYDASRSFTTWMYRVALNVAITSLRDRNRDENRLVAYDDALHDLHAAAGDAHEGAGGLRMLGQVMASLPPLERALLLLYLEGRSTREIADVLGIGESNVTTKIGRLRQRLRNRFAIGGNR